MNREVALLVMKCLGMLLCYLYGSWYGITRTQLYNIESGKAWKEEVCKNAPK